MYLLKGRKKSYFVLQLWLSFQHRIIIIQKLFAYNSKYGKGNDSKLSLDLMLVKTSFNPIYSYFCCILFILHHIIAKNLLLRHPFRKFLLLHRFMIYCFSLLLLCFLLVNYSQAFSIWFTLFILLCRFQLQNEKSTRETWCCIQLACNAVPSTLMLMLLLLFSWESALCQVLKILLIEHFVLCLQFKMNSWLLLL